jgi:hypothetical protein
VGILLGAYELNALMKKRKYKYYTLLATLDIQILIYFKSKKPIKAYLKMSLTLTKGRIVALRPFVLSHIYKALRECQTRCENHLLIMEDINYKVL